MVLMYIAWGEGGKLEAIDCVTATWASAHVDAFLFRVISQSVHQVAAEL